MYLHTFLNLIQWTSEGWTRVPICPLTYVTMKNQLITRPNDLYSPTATSLHVCVLFFKGNIRKRGDVRSERLARNRALHD